MRLIIYLRARCNFSTSAIRTKGVAYTSLLMKPSAARFLNLSEPLAFSGFVAWYIWQLQAVYFFSWLVFPVWMAASFVVHSDTPKTMGWRADNLWTATQRSAVVFSACIG